MVISPPKHTSRPGSGGNKVLVEAVKSSMKKNQGPCWGSQVLNEKQPKSLLGQSTPEGSQGLPKKQGSKKSSNSAVKAEMLFRELGRQYEPALQIQKKLEIPATELASCRNLAAIIFEACAYNTSNEFFQTEDKLRLEKAMRMTKQR